MRGINIVRLISIVFTISMIWLCKYESDKYKYYYKKNTIGCLIISKDIRLYNEGSRYVNLGYENILICNYGGAIIKKSVSDDVYYTNQVGDIVYFNLSMFDIYGAMSNGENTAFTIYFILAIIAILFMVSIKAWELFSQKSDIEPPDEFLGDSLHDRYKVGSSHN